MFGLSLSKGGGSAQGLALLIKDKWVLYREAGVRLLPRWQRRNELMMQGVLTRPGSTRYVIERDPRVPRFIVARTGPTVSAVLAHGVGAALVLPRWEGQPSCMVGAGPEVL